MANNTQSVKLAAALIAEAMVAGRRQRAEKRADLSAIMNAAKAHGGQALSWAGKPENAPITGALTGAAIGGLGSAGLAMTGKRKRNPLAAGLTGAIAGAATGGGIGLGYNALQAGGLSPGLEQAKAVADADALAKTPILSRALNKARSYIADTPDAKDDTFAGLLGEATRRAPGSTVATGTGIMLGTGAAVHGHLVDRVKDNTARFTQGAETLFDKYKPPKPAEMTDAQELRQHQMDALRKTYERATEQPSGGIKSRLTHPFTTDKAVRAGTAAPEDYIRNIHNEANSVGAAAVPHRPLFGAGDAPADPKAKGKGMQSQFRRGAGRFGVGFAAPFAGQAVWNYGTGLLKKPPIDETGGQL